jgi:DNA-binding response OmpR family regulator
MSASNSVSRLSGVGRAHLRTIEANLLQALSSNIGKPMSREELCRQVWKCEFRGTTRTIDQTVATLRKKLLVTQRIVTVHRVGYSYEDENSVYNHASPPAVRPSHSYE